MRSGSVTPKSPLRLASGIVGRSLDGRPRDEEPAVLFQRPPGQVSYYYSTSPVTALERSRPAADASREAVQRWLLDGLDVSVGHRRCSRDPSSQNDVGRTPASQLF